MKKRIISLSIALALIVGCMVFASGSNSVITSADLKFDTTTGYITGYNGTALSVTIPSDMAGYPVRGIGEGAFKNAKITSIEVPASVTDIGKEAFANCTALGTVILPSGVLTIGESAFSGCSALQSITMPSQLLTIGANAFNGCSALKKIEIPYTTTTVGNGAFAKCTSLKKAVIPYSVSSIGTGVFSGCTSLVSVVYQAQDSELPEAFCSGCISLSYFEIPSNITTIGQSAFEGCTSLQSIDIPSNVTYIGPYAYKSCTGLKNIYIPDNVSSVGYQAFAECTGLRTAVLNSEHFGAISGNCEEERSEVFLNCTNLTDVQIGSNTTSLGTGTGKTFAGCTALVNITIPANVITIPDDTFQDHNPNLTIYCQQNSKALEMALGQGIKYSFETAPAFDNTPAQPIIPKDIDVSVNDMYLYFDQEPVVQNERTLVPVRAIFEALGATLDWNQEAQTATAVRGNDVIVIPLNSDVMYKNGEPIQLDVPATAMNGRILVPVRAISEAFNCQVTWDQDQKTVVIVTSQQ